MIIALDRPRELRLTPYSLRRLQSFYKADSFVAAARLIKQEKGQLLIARYLWLFLVDADPELTVEKMEGILAGWLGGGSLWARQRRLQKLRRDMNKLILAIQKEA